MADDCSKWSVRCKAPALIVGLSVVFVLEIHELALGHDIGSAMEALYQAYCALAFFCGVPCLGLAIGAVLSQKHRGWLCALPVIYVLAVLVLLVANGAELWNPWAGTGDHRETRDIHFAASITFLAVAVGCGIVFYKAAAERKSLSWLERLVIAGALAFFLLLEWIVTPMIMEYRNRCEDPWPAPKHNVEAPTQKAPTEKTP